MRVLNVSFLLIVVAIVSQSCRKMHMDMTIPPLDSKIAFAPPGKPGTTYTYSSSLSLPKIIDTTLVTYQMITDVRGSASEATVAKKITFGWSNTKGTNIGETNTIFTALYTYFTRYVPSLEQLERGVAASLGYNVTAYRPNIIFPILTLPHNYNVGDTVIKKEIRVIADTLLAEKKDGTGQLEMLVNRTDSAAYVIGTELLTLPGNSKPYECLKLRGKAHFSFIIKGAPPLVDNVVTNTYWFARGVGLVKMQAIAASDDGTTWTIYSSDLLALKKQ